MAENVDARLTKLERWQGVHEERCETRWRESAARAQKQREDHENVDVRVRKIEMHFARIDASTRTIAWICGAFSALITLAGVIVGIWVAFHH